MSAERWWLINQADVAEIRQALLAAQGAQAERCEQAGCMCDLYDTPCNQAFTDALHSLDSGLHRTDAVPSDWREDPPR